jgi:predicted heme/steroid binding protein
MKWVIPVILISFCILGCAKQQNICMTKPNALAVTDKCLVIYDNKVYDLTHAEGWNLSGHFGGHELCGMEYTKEEINKGHSESALDEYFYASVCGG